MAKALNSARARGFSIIEAMVATGVLGIGLIGLVNLHTASLRGIKASEQRSSGSEVAEAIIEGIISQQALNGANPPACNLGPALPPNAGCRNGGLGAMAYNGALGGGCTMYFDGPPHLLATPPMPPAWNPWDQTLANPNDLYRVDVGIVNHPDAIEHPNSQYLYVWVCWQDENGFIHQVSSERLITFGF